MLYRPASAREVPKSTPRPPSQSKNESDSFLPIRASSAPRSLSKKPELSTHQNFLKQSLELDAKSLDYRRKEGSRNSNMLSFSEPQVEKAEPEEKAPLELHEIHYLITTGDMNNYYTSLLSWCPLSQKLALGINEDAYWWDGELTVERLWNNGRYSSITCLKCGGGFVLVAAESGKVTIMDVLGCCKGSFFIEAGILCAVWNRGCFYVGDREGIIYSIRVRDELIVTPLCHEFRQQVTGITVSKDGQFLAAGGNENKVITWRIRETRLEKITTLNHLAAVKALDFCPWSSPPSLLVTGAGSNDRCIRVWHFTSGAIVKSLSTTGQITNIAWSETRREIAVSFGHSFDPPAGVVGVYTYPDFELVARVAGGGLRAFNSDISPDQTKIAVATQDGMVRMYRLWKGDNEDDSSTAVSAESSSDSRPRPTEKDFDSSIISLVEEINTSLVLR